MFANIFACLLAAMQFLFLNVVYGPWGPDSDPPLPPGPPGYDISADSPLSPSVLYAAGMANVPQGWYPDAARDTYAMGNAEVTLTHSLRYGKRATLQSNAGGTYLKDTMDVFYTAGGRTYYATDSVQNGRANTTRLGLYYYENRIRDLNFSRASGGAFWADKIYHLYGDRLYQELVLIAAVPTTALQSFGLEVKIPVGDVAAVEHNEAYAAFDIKDVGVVGFIFPSDGSTGGVTLDTVGGYYVLRQTAAYAPGTPLRARDGSGTGLADLRFGSRIYTDATHSFAGVAAAALEERSPLTGITVQSGNSNAAYLGYDHLRGCYTFGMDGMSFNQAYYQHRDKRFEAPLSFASGTDRDIYVRATSAQGGGNLEAAAILDGGGLLAPMQAQVCKNFGAINEPFYGPYCPTYSDCFIPLRLLKDEPVELTVLHLYQNWGQFPLKQISSIEYNTAYYHLSTGVTESNCITPHFTIGRDAWTLPDFRTASGVLWEEQPQFNSVGRLRFVNYRRSLLKTNLSEHLFSRIDSASPSYADITLAFRADCGSYDYTLRHLEFPQTDENRTYYSLDLTFNRDMTFLNARRDFELFSFDGRHVRYKQAGWLDKENRFQTREINKPPLGIGLFARTEYYPLGDGCPMFGFFDIPSEWIEYDIFGCNFALIVKDSEITLGGAPWDGGFTFKYDDDGKYNYGALALDAGCLAFKAGDSIRVDFVLLPYGTGFETDDARARAVREDSCLVPLRVTAAVGSVVPDAWLPIIDSDDGLAQFTLSGGAGVSAVRVNGFESHACPNLEKWTGTAWETVTLAGPNSDDGYTVFYNPVTGLYDFAFVVETAGGTVEYRCVQ